ncbi:MAG: phosphoribosylglycinamide formyltransferase [Armatimonadota bacterium]|nr:phosphoribosylglycinamide formyltransferase [Armatimonadota bacterium]MDR7450150.1 phosphoribosylglycinamide formyltransferase [Armatimonadota bacterium]MDR7480211.1 phosphoribosylglycinamide formyltransferase [Armatimonadota bacterium]MDR7487996.1 phosphoribosylglycinamide formyltransferase [Armatimonadota bacterium]MDR7491950.1 phosphoribosylglycinamide formyltransferase [Armatimonadota bacterium]
MTTDPRIALRGDPLRVGVLVSGQGTTLQALLDDAASGAPYAVVLVLSNVPDAPALDRARRAGVPTCTVDHRGRPRQAFEVDVAQALEAAQVELVCLAGFLRILSPWFVERFRGRVVNIHPSLLPRFGGRGMYGLRVHQAVLAAGDRQSGCTVHLVDETPDGGPVLAQAVVPVLPQDTPERLAQRVAAVEHRLYPQVVRAIADGRLLGLRPPAPSAQDGAPAALRVGAP